MSNSVTRRLKYIVRPSRLSHGITGMHETRAAVEAGNTVRSEVEKFKRHYRAESRN